MAFILDLRHHNGRGTLEYSSMIEAVDRFFQDEVRSAGQDTFKFTFSFGSIHKRVE